MVTRAFLGRAFVSALAVSLLPNAAALARGTDNHVLKAVPVPGAVVVDGRLGDWDRSGRILVCSDVDRLVGSFSAFVSMMYDGEALYVGVDWSDPTPMVNNYHPDLDIDRRKCFHSDSIQLHFRTDRTRKVIGWHFTREKRPGVISLDGWMPWHDKPIVYIDGQKELGITEGFAKKPDGTGYTQELRIPWKAIVKTGRAYRAGESFDCMLDLVWGPDSGKGWPVNHMMDLVEPGAVHTGWFWEVKEIYGKVELSPVGNLETDGDDEGERGEVASESGRHRIPGSFPVRVRLPDADASAFTLAIEDKEGGRVRSLPGDCRPEVYRLGGETDGDAGDQGREIEVMWDCLDDRGRLAEPGEYRVIGLTRGEIDPVYDMCFYNPGTPPWGTVDGRGAWGADHSPPGVVAAAGDFVVIGWGGAEGGSGIIGVGPDGLKKWGEHQGALALAADESHVYFMLNDPWAGKRGLARLGARDGSYRPYEIGGEKLLPVPLGRIFGNDPPGEVRGMAVRGDRLVLSLDSWKLAVIDAATARLVKTLDAKDPGDVAFAPDGRLVALLEGRPHEVDLETGEATPLGLRGLGEPTAVAVDADGNLAFADMGADSQVKVYSPSGKLVRRIGRRGGRPIRGPFDPAAMMRVESIAFDARGMLWAVESWDHPRRVSVWDERGRLVRDYVGNTPYSACGTYLHDQDPTLAYSGTVEMRLDRLLREWSVTRVLWLPERSKGEGLPITGGLPQPHRFTSSASGRPREYLFNHPWDSSTGFTVYMERRSGWKPVAAICLVGHISGRVNRHGTVEEEPSGEFADLNAYDGCFWNDTNRDGIAQRAECEIVPAKRAAAKGKSGERPISFQNGWGGRMGRDLSIYSDGIVVYRPVGFDREGAPRYGTEGMKELGVSDRGDLIPVEDENVLLILSSTGYGETSYALGLELGTWRELWRYPSFGHGVHGSHHVSMPEPGKIIGALKITGVAKVSESAGSVFAVRGNLGEDFLMTTDGLYVGAMFRDSRMPGPALPETEKELVGKSVARLTEGGEPFNGWFGRQADGKIRMLTGIPGQAAMIVEVRGLETIRRFRGPSFRVTQADIVEAEQANARRAAARSARKRYAVRRFAKLPVIDAREDEWRATPAGEITRKGSPERGRFRLAWDERNLYVFFHVSDPSPWMNEGKDFRRLFKTGDAVDVQLSTDPGVADAASPGPSHVRLLFAPLEGRPACVLMRPVAPGEPRERSHRYGSPVGERRFDVVELLAEACVAARRERDRYWMEAAVPLAALGLRPSPGMTVRGDAGFISSDARGIVNVARTYWSNRVTNLTNDMPSEAWLYPATWGELVFE